MDGPLPLGILEFRVRKEQITAGYGRGISRLFAPSPSSAVLEMLRKDVKPAGFRLSRPHGGASGELRVRCMAGSAFIEIALRHQPAGDELLVTLEAQGYPGLLGPNWYLDLQHSWEELSQALTGAVQRRFYPPSVRLLRPSRAARNTAVPDFAG